MSYREINGGSFSFLDIIQDGRKALNAGLYRVAFLTALIVPSVCSRIEFEDNPKYKDDGGRWRDKECYIDWCLQNDIQFLDAEGKYKSKDPNRLNEEYYEKVYDIRCAVVHESSAHCDGDVCVFCINNNENICRKVNCDRRKQYDICLIQFCNQMFNIGEEYCKNHADKFQSTKINLRDFVEV